MVKKIVNDEIDLSEKVQGPNWQFFLIMIMIMIIIIIIIISLRCRTSCGDLFHLYKVIGGLDEVRFGKERHKKLFFLY